ncbi:MAG: hypothetical protein NZ557_03295, partial [Chthonomonadaceae bacterium]|nr:hypothetical protein [Chthonomonadaceae bacterium]
MRRSLRRPHGASAARVEPFLRALVSITALGLTLLTAYTERLTPASPGIMLLILLMLVLAHTHPIAGSRNRPL